MNDVCSEIPVKYPLSETTIGVGNNDLRDLILPSEFTNGFGDIPAADHSRFNLKAPRETKGVALGILDKERVQDRLRHSKSIGLRGDKDPRTVVKELR